MLLHVLGFTARDSHTTVSPCALPTWAEKATVNRVNQKLGKQLRQELVGIMQCSSLVEVVPMSIESQSSFKSSRTTSRGMDMQGLTSCLGFIDKLRKLVVQRLS